MGRQFIKQPNGLYAVYSTIIDAFVVWDVSAEWIIEDAAQTAAENARARCKEAIAEADQGKVPYLSLSWHDALANHNKNSKPDDRIEV